MLAVVSLAEPVAPLRPADELVASAQVRPADELVARPSRQLLDSYSQRWWRVRLGTRFSPGENLRQTTRRTGKVFSADAYRRSIGVLNQDITVEAQLDASSVVPGPSGSTQGASSSGWSIPDSVVQCESGGQNLPPNSATASGYYQIIDSTWQANGGSTQEAWQAPKDEQDRVAARIWATDGPAAWVCK